MNITERIEKLVLARRPQIGVRGVKRDISKTCGISYEAVRQWFAGDTGNIKNENLLAIAAGYDTTVDWLLSGEGEPPFRSAEEPSNVLPVTQPERLYRYPVVSEVQAGAWTEAVQPYAPGAEDRFELTDYKAKGPAFWLEVSGDSMTSPTRPSIPEGHFILVDTGLVPQPGDLVVAKLDTEEKATFKKLVSDAGQLYLKPLNPAYRMIPIDGNCRLIGVVKEAKMKL